MQWSSLFLWQSISSISSAIPCFLIFFSRLSSQNKAGVPRWLSWLGFQLLVSAQVMISESWDQDPHWALCSSWSVLVPLPPPAYAFFSLSLTNTCIHTIFKNKPKKIRDFPYLLFINILVSQNSLPTFGFRFYTPSFLIPSLLLLTSSPEYACLIVFLSPGPIYTNIT